jgi:hypothetical protein
MLNGAVPTAIETASGLGAKSAGPRQVGLDFVKKVAREAVTENLKASPSHSPSPVSGACSHSALRFMKCGDYRINSAPRN